MNPGVAVPPATAGAGNRVTLRRKPLGIAVLYVGNNLDQVRSPRSFAAAADADAPWATTMQKV